MTGTFVLLATPVRAGEIPNGNGYGIFNARIEKDSYEQYSDVKAFFDWAVPDGSKRGDTISLDLPGVLDANNSTPFTLTDTDDPSIVIGEGVFDGASNRLTITFTTDYVETRQNVRGNAFFLSKFRQDALNLDGGSQTVDIFGQQVTITKQKGVDGPEPEGKQGWWTNSQAYATAVDEQGALLRPNEAQLEYVLIFSNERWSRVVVNDTPDPDLLYCTPEGNTALGAYMHLEWRSVDGGLWSRENVPPGFEKNVSCTPGQSFPNITVTKPADRQDVQLRLIYGLKVRTNEAGQPVHGGGVGFKPSYENSVVFVYDDADRRTFDYQVSLEAAGGQGTGVTAPAVDIEKYSGDWAGVQWNGDSPRVGGAPDYEPLELPAGDHDEAPGLELDPDAGQTVRFTVTNIGIEDLKQVVVSDRTGQGEPLTGLRCTVEGVVHEADGEGEVKLGEWVFPRKASFECEASLPAQGENAAHADIARVTAVSVTSSTPVEDNDAWHARTGAKPRVSVGDFVWFDADGDGLQGAGESGIEGVELTLSGPGGVPVTGVDGRPVGPVRTDAQGAYSFDGLPVLPAGQHYTVTVVAPEGFVPTVAGVGEDRAVDSSTGSAESGDLVQDGQRDPSLDFGFVKASVSVGDFVWFDADGDGLQG
ncbi:MAG: SdrD B-like domain-containing protein, partial [Pseudoclavibacter sp.]|nr:SdrD B-like domain-containing protein [Pseudoclavibacter sp.]